MKSLSSQEMAAVMSASLRLANQVVNDDQRPITSMRLGGWAEARGVLFTSVAHDFFQRALDEYDTYGSFPDGLLEMNEISPE